MTVQALSLTSSLLIACVVISASGCPGNEPRLDPALTGGTGGAGGAGASGGASVCGDGTQDDDEACDDDNVEPGDGCRADCTVESCGDGIVDANMTCFRTPVTYSAPSVVTPLIADLDGDGIPDLVLWGESLSRRLATSPGTFGPTSIISSAAGEATVGQANDGVDSLADLLVNDDGDGGSYVNDGDGGFPSFTSKGTLANAPQIGAGDLDGDGNADLCVTGAAAGLDIYLSQGDGTFANAVTKPGHPSKRTLAADMTGDGWIDVLALNYDDGGSVGFYAGNGDGSVADQVRTTVPDNCVLDQLDVGDCDGDGHPDVVVGSSCGAKPIYVMFGDGAGLFSNAVSLATGGATTRSVQFADVDNDGELDVIAGTSSSEVLFYAGDGAGGFVESVTLLSLGDGEVRLTTADLDGDGATDIVATTATKGVSVILADP